MKTYKIVTSDSAFTSKMKGQRIKFANSVLDALSFSSEDKMKLVVLNSRDILSDMPKKYVNKLLDDMYFSFYAVMKLSDEVKEFISESHANDNDYVFDHSSEVSAIKDEIAAMQEACASIAKDIEKLSGEYAKFIVTPEAFVSLLKGVKKKQDDVARRIKTVVSMMEEAFI